LPIEAPGDALSVATFSVCVRPRSPRHAATYCPVSVRRPSVRENATGVASEPMCRFDSLRVPSNSNACPAVPFTRAARDIDVFYPTPTRDATGFAASASARSKTFRIHNGEGEVVELHAGRERCEVLGRIHQ